MHMPHNIRYIVIHAGSLLDCYEYSQTPQIRDCGSRELAYLFLLFLARGGL